MRIDDGGARIVYSMALFVFAVIVVFPCGAQEKVRFPIGESSKTLSYGPLWVAAKMGFFERENLEVPIVTMRGSPLTIQALTADSIYIANATVDTLISAHERGADIAMIGGLINGLGLAMVGGKQYKATSLVILPMTSLTFSSMSISSNAPGPKRIGRWWFAS